MSAQPIRNDFAEQGLYAGSLPPREPTLGELIDAADLAWKRCDYRGSEAEIDRKEAAREDAEASLRAYLSGRLGLTKAQMDALGGIL